MTWTALALWATTAWAAPVAWTTEPFARDLHPVHTEALFQRWHEEMQAQMAGPQASAVFRSQASRMDALLRIAEFDGRMPYVSRERERETIELAVTGASLGTFALTGLLQESDGFESTRGVVRSLLNPSLRLRGDGGGRVSADADNRSNREDIATAALLDPTDWGGPRRGTDRRARPSLRTGLSGSIVADLDPALEGSGYGDDRGPTPSPVPSTEDVAVDAVRLQVTGRPAPGFEQLGLSWSSLARQQLGRRTAIIGEVYGGMADLADPTDDLRPHFWRAALDVRVAPTRRWIVRTSVARADRGELGTEHIAAVSFRVNSAWRLPWSARGYPRGQVPGEVAPAWPRLPDRGPNPTAPAVQTPVERLAEDGVSPPRRAASTGWPTRPIPKAPETTPPPPRRDSPPRPALPTPSAMPTSPCSDAPRPWLRPARPGAGRWTRG